MDSIRKYHNVRAGGVPPWLTASVPGTGRVLVAVVAAGVVADVVGVDDCGVGCWADPADSPQPARRTVAANPVRRTRITGPR